MIDSSWATHVRHRTTLLSCKCHALVQHVITQTLTFGSQLFTSMSGLFQIQSQSITPLQEHHGQAKQTTTAFTRCYNMSNWCIQNPAMNTMDKVNQGHFKDRKAVSVASEGWTSLISAKVASDKGCCDVIDSSWGNTRPAQNQTFILQTVTHLSSMSSPKLLRLVHNFTSMSGLFQIQSQSITPLQENHGQAKQTTTAFTRCCNMSHRCSRNPAINTMDKVNQGHFKDRKAVSVASEGWT